MNEEEKNNISDKKGFSGQLASFFNFFKKLKSAENNTINSDKNQDSFKKKKAELRDYHEDVAREKSARRKKRGDSFEYSDPVETSNDMPSGWKSAFKKLPAYPWQADSSVLRTNLIEDEVTTFVDWSKNLKLLAINIFISCSVIGLLYGGLLIWETNAKQHKTEIEGNIKELEVKIKRMEKEVGEVDAFEAKLSKVAALLNRHVYWTQFFAFLEKNTLSNIVYTGGFSGNTGGSYSFNSRTNDFRTIANQIKVFKQNELVKSVLVTEGDSSFKLPTDKESEEFGSRIINYSLQLVLDPNIFSKQLPDREAVK